MTYLKWTLGAILILAVVAILNWTLPSREIVRILGTEVARRNVETTNERGESVVRSQDVRYIKTVTPDGEPQVYRNEDTGWGWPPYFKFDTANLAAEADNAASGEENPRWMVVTSYGWRIPLFSKFPNAVSIRPASGPDETLIPWFNIVVIVLLLVLAFLIRRWILRFFRPRASDTTE